MKTITKRQRQRLEAALRAKIRHYEKCMALMPSLDAEVFAAGMSLVGNNHMGLVNWLCTPARSLGYKVPLVAARTAKGRRTVINILGALDDGGYL